METHSRERSSLAKLNRRLLLTAPVALGAGLMARSDPAAAAQFDQTHVKLVWESSGSAEEPLIGPEGIALAPDGSVYVVSSKRDVIQIIGGDDGEFIAQWGEPGDEPGQFRFRGPDGSFLGDVDFDADGNIYVFDTYNQRIQKFDPERTFLLEITGDGSAEGVFQEPTGSVDAAGKRIFVTDFPTQQVQVFDLDGNFLWKWGSQGVEDGQFFWPAGITVASDGSIYVAEIKGKRVQKFDTDGNFLQRVAGSGEEPGQVMDLYYLAVDANDNLYVSDTINRRIQIFSADGALIGMIDDVPSVGPFQWPAGIAVDAEGFIYLADAIEHRVLKLELPPLE